MGLCGGRGDGQLRIKKSLVKGSSGSSSWGHLHIFLPWSSFTLGTLVVTLAVHHTSSHIITHHHTSHIARVPTSWARCCGPRATPSCWRGSRSTPAQQGSTCRFVGVHVGGGGWSCWAAEEQRRGSGSSRGRGRVSAKYSVFGEGAGKSTCSLSCFWTLSGESVSVPVTPVAQPVHLWLSSYVCVRVCVH